MKYPKVPDPLRHVVYAVSLTLLVALFLYLINPELAVSAATRRFIVRSGALFLVVGSVLGVFSINWSAKNRLKLSAAQREIVTCTEAARALESASGKSGIDEELAAYGNRKAVACRMLEQAGSFDDSVTKVAFGALGFLVVGTILQAVAA